ncbi:Ion channel [Aphelenchoides besseyi]|nr:Ion channel [Aphelenchoides besseyi]
MSIVNPRVDPILRKRRLKRRRRFCPFLYVFVLPPFTVLGACLFMTLEKDSDPFRDSLAECERIGNGTMNTLKLLMNTTSNWTEVENNIMLPIDCLREVVSRNSRKPFDFLGANVFAISVFSTLGYGELVPSTNLSKISTIIYAFFGIPLYIAFIADLGEWISMGLKQITSLSHRQIVDKTYALSKSHRIAERRVMLIVLLITVLTYTFSISAILMVIETFAAKNPFNYLDSVAFVFTSIARIGFGDLIPNQSYFLLIEFPLIVFGQCLLAMLFFKMQKGIRYTLPRLFSKCCLSLMSHCFGQSSNNVDDHEVWDEALDENFQARLAVCVNTSESAIGDQTAPSEVEARSPQSNQRSNFLNTMKTGIENFLPWDNEVDEYNEPVTLASEIITKDL